MLKSVLLKAIINTVFSFITFVWLFLLYLFLGIVAGPTVILANPTVILIVYFLPNFVLSFFAGWINSYQLERIATGKKDFTREIAMNYTIIAVKLSFRAFILCFIYSLFSGILARFLSGDFIGSFIAINILLSIIIMIQFLNQKMPFAFHK